MRNRTLMLVVAALMTQSLVAVANGAEGVKEFADYRCNLTLPSPRFEWLDHSKISHAVVALGDDSRILLFMVAERAPDGFDGG